MLTKNKYGQTAGHLAAACATIQTLFMLWECTKGQLTPDELNSKLRLDRYLEKDCLAHGGIHGKIEVLDILWEWAKEVLTPEDISNKFF